MTSFRDTALALLEAEEAGNQAQTLREALMEKHVHPKFLVDFVTIIVGVLAFDAETTPRTVYDQLFAGCPSDDDWRQMVEAWQEARGDGGD